VQSLLDLNAQSLEDAVDEDVKTLCEFQTMLPSLRRALRVIPPSSPVVPAWNRSLAVATAITESSEPFIKPARNAQRIGQSI